MRLKIGVKANKHHWTSILFFLNIYKNHTEDNSHLYFIHYRSCGGTSVPPPLEFPWVVACDIWKNWMVNDGLLGVWLNAYHWAFSASAAASFSFSASSLSRAFLSMLRAVRLSCRPTACHRRHLLKDLTAIKDTISFIHCFITCLPEITIPRHARRVSAIMT